jgi:leucyl-tRNA synthetase
MEKYNPWKIEAKWQKKWSKNPKLNKADDASKKPKYYCLDMFPYPSAEGLHMGHTETYVGSDIVSRYRRMNGYNVLHSQGWDALGLPAENYAIKVKTHPAITTNRAIKNYKRQMGMIGFSYDWSREVNSSDPDYYRWTQWFFLLLYKNGLAYRGVGKVNWCDSCQTVLANEQAEGGKCDRCGSQVIQKDLEQWFFKITDFIEDKKNKKGRKTSGLIKGLDNVDWPESTKKGQINWIGKSEGTIIKFQIISSKSGNKKAGFFANAQNDGYNLEVFTTRVDTIFGCTYCVVAPEHEIISKMKNQISNIGEVEKYVKNSKRKSDLDRIEAKVKTGVEIKSIKAVNPFNGEKVPVFVADYVLGHYGTGAVMAVPAHDERDWEFAKKYKLLIRKSIESAITMVVTLKKSLKNDFYDKVKNFASVVEKDGLAYIYSDEVDKIFDFAETSFIGDTWYIHSEGPIKKILFHTREDNKRFDWSENVNHSKAYRYGLKIGIPKKQLDWEGAYEATINDGVVINSEQFSGLTSEKARIKMTAWLENNKLGGKKINYKIRDWLVSRQRYWGAPIPIIYCEKCVVVPVPEKDLPVKLPMDVDFRPKGKSPLERSKSFHNVKCPVCGRKARRESDTMDTFVCSSWYYFRYADPKNKKKFASPEKIKKWLPVDLYIGGAEHTVLHLLYARFFTKVLHHLGYIDFDEPFSKMRHQGIILGEDGEKMSKSRGNVVNPDDVVKKVGADALRLYMMFMGPYEDSKAWDSKSIVGLSRFLERVWKLQHLVSFDNRANGNTSPILHKTIKKVTEDIENMRFNTAISQMMIFVNDIEKEDKISRNDLKSFLRILAPFAPHIAEELWEKMDGKKSIFLEKWPAYDPEMIKEEKIEMVIQINGKVRDRIFVETDISQEKAEILALKSEKIRDNLGGKNIRKVIFVKNKLLNIVA